MHGLDVEELHCPFQGGAIGGDLDFIEGQVVLDDCPFLAGHCAAAGGVEASQDAVFGQVDRQLDELSVDLPHGLGGLFGEGFLEG